MSKSVMSIKYSSRSGDDLHHPVKALRFETEVAVPELLIESLEDAGFFATPHATIAQLVVTPCYATSGIAMIERLIEVLSAWNQVHIGYSLSDGDDRDLWMSSEFAQPSRSLCEPPANSEQLRQIGRLRFEYDACMAAECYEEAKALKTDLDRLTDEVSRTAA